MDPLHVAIAIIPVAMYLLLIGWINLSPRPFLTTGVRDLATLTLAITGFMVCGPLELFLPETVASIVGGWVWLPMLLLFSLAVTLVLLLMRPRLIIYNISQEHLRPILQQTIQELDPGAIWAGDCVVAPKLGVQMAIEAYAGIRNVSIASVGPDQDLEGWRRVEAQLRKSLQNSRQPANTQGFSFVFLSVVLTAGVIYSLLNGRQEIAQAFRELMRM